MNLLDRAVKLAAEQDEPDEVNFVRKHAKEQVRTATEIRVKCSPKPFASSAAAAVICREHEAGHCCT